MNRRDLPIFELEAQLIYTLRNHSRIVLEAPTGSGKSTQVPQMLLDHGFAETGEIVVLQPRRLPARMLAARVAQERGCQIGGEVGYQIRLDRVASKSTKIRYVTEGILLRQMLADPTLPGVAAICFDEFHERHLYGDITLARALELQETVRPDLKLIVMSATLDSAALENYMAPCQVLNSRGRTYPVDIRYLAKPAGDWPVWELVAEEFERIAPQTEGDVLVFLTGSYEIQRTLQALRETRTGRNCVLLPLHGELPPNEQDAAVARYERRKVIVSTNVAETSLTIDGVRVVIDAGFARMARFDPYRGINTLLIERISRASADQRAGRAGRTAPGICLRLWTEREHLERPAQELPEVKRLDLAEVVLTLKASGVEDVARFRWLEAPESRSLERALLLLTDLGALDEGEKLTELGRRMLAFPAHPRYARMLLAAHEQGCVPAVAMVSALTQGRGLLRRPEGREMEQEREALVGDEEESDLMILMRAQKVAEQAQFNPQRCRPLGIHGGAAREAGALAKQFLQIARDEGLNTDDTNASSDAVQRCVVAGFPDQVALRVDAGTLRCQLVHGRRGVLARESVVQKAALLVACEVREVEGKASEKQVLLTLATAVKEEWLRELFPASFVEKIDVSFDSVQRRVVARRIVRFRDLTLRSKETDSVPLDAAAVLLAEEVEAGRCVLKSWDDAVDQWITRVNLVAEWFPEWEIPPISEEDRRMLVEQICHGAVSYREIKERAVWPVVKSWLSHAQAELVDKYAPERVEMPNGRKFKVAYAGKAAPTIGVRIQDLYGVEGEVRIAGGRVALVIQVLAPNQRPIQVTQNLSNFWKESYPKIKLELQRKYPKHEWR
ncbi:MAG: ATP-dependent helicase HrpB [Verrucomicrobiota bacterium]